MKDDFYREAIQSDLEKTLVVEAAAGTGKTTALVSRILAVISTGLGELSRIAAVTFTEKAAGELKLRLRSELERARAAAREKGDPVVLRRLERGLSQLEEAHVGTIHGFCADLLKQRPLQAGVDPQFEVATDEEKDRLYRRVFERWLEEKLSDPPPGVRRLLRRAAKNEEGPVDQLYKAGCDLLEVRDFPARWQLRPFEREVEIDALLEKLVSLAERAARPANRKDYLFEDLTELIALAQDLRGQEQVSGKRDYDALEHRLCELKLGKRKGGGPYAEGISRERLLAERDALASDLASFAKRTKADLAARLQNELLELVERYTSLKSKRGRLDFLDLLVRARDLLKNDAEARRELQSTFSHIFVDEFQDTDPLQVEILLLLASADPEEDDWRKVTPIPGKLFLVADPKQSIYRFRRADVSLYQRVKEMLQRAGAQPAYLTVSFRSVPEIQALVNSTMSAAMKPTHQNHQADYVPLHEERRNIPGQPAVIALPIPRPYGDWGRLTFYAMQKSEPRAVAAWVRWLLEESGSLGWRVSSRRSDELRPIRPSDVCLLFRRFVNYGKPVTQPYVDALAELDVAHVLVGGRGFHQREEIDAIRVALAAIERPDDELSVFSTLRGPLFALGDESLFLFRSQHGPLHPFRATSGPLEGEASSIRGALDVLGSLHRDRNRRPIALTLRELLDRTRSHAGFALWQPGDQVLANVLRLLQIARTFEEGGGLSFRGFVDHLDALAEESDRSEQPMIEDGVEGVRLMTVHKAKGLEFPVVVLCDVTCQLSTGASRHVDPDRKLWAMRLAGCSPAELLEHEEIESERDRAESLRLLYVAATRARDLLVVPAVGDEPQRNGWVGPLLPGLYPSEDRRPFAVVAPGAPGFPGRDTVLERPPHLDVIPIRPGLHKAEVGGHDVLWWDPSLFEPLPKPKPGLRRYAILSETPGETVSEGAREHERWLERRARLIEAGSAPLYRVATVTRLVEIEKPAVPRASEVQVAETEGRDLLRPGGKRFGALVHEVFSRAALDAPPAHVEELALSLGRMFDNTDEERQAAAAAVSRALAHPLLEQARRASEIFRETPLVYREPSGRLIEGVPDLVFRDPSREWTVVDFKTDLRIDIALDAHRSQVALYRIALEEATGLRSEGWLLYL